MTFSFTRCVLEDSDHALTSYTSAQGPAGWLYAPLAPHLAVYECQKGSQYRLVQTSIQAEGFRSLREGEAVEYELDTAEDGRSKAIKVSGPDGAPPQVPDG